MLSTIRTTVAVVAFLATFGCGQEYPSSFVATVKPAADPRHVKVLSTIIDDVKSGDGKTQIFRTFDLKQLPPNIALEEPPYKALGFADQLAWPEIFQEQFRLYPSLDSVVTNRKQFNGPILVVRLDKLGLEPTNAIGGNCRVVVTVVDSDNFPTHALGLNYLASRADANWTVELVLID